MAAAEISRDSHFFYPEWQSLCVYLKHTFTQFHSHLSSTITGLHAFPFSVTIIRSLCCSTAPRKHIDTDKEDVSW